MMISDAAMKSKMFSAGPDWMMGDRQLPPTDKNKQKEPSHNEMTLYIITGNFLSLLAYPRGVSRLVNTPYAKASCKTRPSVEVEQMTLTAEGRRPGSNTK